MSEAEKIKILSNVLGTSYREGHNQLLFYCPSCEHQKKKLSINVERNLFKCWVCDYSGRNVFRIIKRFGTYSDKKEWSRLTQRVEIENFSEKLFGSVIRWKIGYCSSGKYEGRVIFPSFNLSGDLNYFVGRSYAGDWKRYINPSTKNDIVFNHLSLDFLQPIVIVEGVFDAVKSGINSVPLLGSTLSEESILFSEIVKNDTTIYLALDSDAKKKAERMIRLFLKYDIEIYVIDIEQTVHEDVGEMSKEEFETLKTKAEKLDAEKFLINRILKM